MRWPLLVMAFALTACQPQGSARLIPSPSPASSPGDLIYLQDPSGPRMLEMDWSGKVHGSVTSPGFSSPSPDGSRFLRATTAVSAEDWQGQSLGRLDLDPNFYGVATWADDGRHVCGVVVSSSGPDAGKSSLWIGAPGEAGRIVAAVGKPDSQPGIAACSLENDRAVVASGLFPHWPPGTTRYLITAEIQVVRLSTGAVEYEHQYPLGYLAGQGAPDGAPDWVLVAASPDAHYVAESVIFNGTTVIRELPSGKPVSSVHGSVRGFSWDGSRIVVSLWNGGSDYQAELVHWADQKILWHRSAAAQSMLAKPSSTDVLIGVSGAAGGAPELVVIDHAGAATTIARDAMVTWPCPCRQALKAPAGASSAGPPPECPGSATSRAAA